MQRTELNPQSQNHKEKIRKSIRYGLVTKAEIPTYGLDASEAHLPLITKPYEEFVKKFRAAGGFFIPCKLEEVVLYLQKLLETSKYGVVLNTNPNLKRFLKNTGSVQFVDTISPNERVDAAVVFSDILIARTGAIGFKQKASRYASVRNLSSNLIVISSMSSIYLELEDALNAQRQEHGDKNYPMMEFIIPKKIEDEEGKIVATPQEPRVALFMVQDGLKVQPQRVVTEKGQPEPEPQLEPESQPTPDPVESTPTYASTTSTSEESAATRLVDPLYTSDSDNNITDLSDYGDEFQN